MERVKLKNVLKQYRNTHWVEDKDYKQVTISQSGEVSYRGTKHGSQIGRKRQFIIDLKNHPNTLIFIRQGVFNGGIGICPKEVEGCIVTENMPMFDIVGINPEYLINYTKSPQFKSDVGKLVPLGTAQKAIHERQLLEIEVPIPLLKEQEEIVGRLRVALNNTREINAINSSNTSLISSLRQQILQEAVQGKLVPQNPNDEPASELLKKIKSEKEKLIREGKIKKDKLLPPISSDEIPYDLPKGWEWCRLGEIFKTSSGGTPDRSISAYYGGKIHWLKSGELNDNLRINKSEEMITEEGLKNSSAKIFRKGSLVLALYGATAGKLGILDFDATTNQAVCNFEKNRFIENMYLFYFLKSFREKILSEGFGGAQPNISQDYVKKLIFPLPPLSEQKRIVEKVDKLMALCDELEKQVKENQENAEKLMDAVLRESFERRETL